MIYILLILLAVITELFLEKLNIQKRKKIFIYFMFLIVGILIAFRNEYVGSDTRSYLAMYEKFRSMSIKNIIDTEGIEIGYILLVKILNKISVNPQIILIFQAILVSLIYARFFANNSKNTFLSFWGFMTFGIFSFQLTGIRQGIAMAICIIAIEYIKQKNILKFITTVFIGSLFHTSAIFFIVAYPIGTMNVCRKNTFKIISIGILGVFFIEPLIKILGNVSDRYTNYGIEGSGTGSIFLMIILSISILVEKYKYKIISNNPNNSIFIQLNYINCVLWTMRLITRVAERPSLYFMPATIIVMSEVFSAINDRKLALFIYSISVTSIVILFLYRMSAVPYTFI